MCRWRFACCAVGDGWECRAVGGLELRFGRLFTGKRNDEENAKEKLFTYATYVPVETFKVRSFPFYPALVSLRLTTPLLSFTGSGDCGRRRGVNAHFTSFCFLLPSAAAVMIPPRAPSPGAEGRSVVCRPSSIRCIMPSAMHLHHVRPHTTYCPICYVMHPKTKLHFRTVGVPRVSVSKLA